MNDEERAAWLKAVAEDGSDWDDEYQGEVMELTRARLVELLNLDSEMLVSANHHAEAEALADLAKIVELTDTPIHWFAWHVSDIGTIRQCVVKVEPEEPKPLPADYWETGK